MLPIFRLRHSLRLALTRSELLKSMRVVMTGRWMAIGGTLLGRVVFELPFVTEGIACFGQPFGIISQYFNLDAGKMFDRAGCRVSQRLQQTEADQDRDVFRLEAKPGRFQQE